MRSERPGRGLLSHSLPVAVGLYLAAMALFVATDTVAKHLLAVYAIVFIVWVRFCVQFGLLMLLLPSPRRARLRTRHFRLLVLRALAWMGITFLFYTGLRYVPLAESIMLVSTGPFMVALLAGPVLGERIGARTWVAVLLGFAGVLVVLRPGLGVLHWGAIFPILTAAAFSVAQLVTRRLSQREDSWTILIYSSGLCALALTPFGLAAWSAAPPLDWLMLVSIGGLAVAGEVGMLAALRRAPASTLAPLQYTQIVWAMAAGVLVFGELPDGLALVGAAIIVAGGLVLWTGGARRGSRAGG